MILVNPIKLRKWSKSNKGVITLHFSIYYDEIIDDHGIRNYNPNGRIRYFGTITSEQITVELTNHQYIKLLKKYYPELHN